jgi:hypothetical protein
MNARDDDRDRVEERRFDWALREVAGGERLPDVTAAVLARVAAGETGDEVMAAFAPRGRWLALAAVFLLGALTVFGVALLQREPEPNDMPVDEVQEPFKELLIVRSAEAIATLPVELKAIELRNLTNAEVAALVARCPKLEHLRVVFDRADQAGRQPRFDDITDVAFQSIGALATLRTFELVNVKEFTAAGLRELARIPLLHTVRLWGNVPDELLTALAHLPSLRCLAVDQNVVLGPAGIAAVGQCVGLRQLSLRWNATPPTGALEPLARLQELEEIALEPSPFAEKSRDAEGDGLRTSALQHWPRLRSLSLRHARRLEADVGRVLRERYPRLRSLDLSGCPLVDDTTIAQVVGIRSLRVLRIAGCRSIAEPSMPLLAMAQQLRTIDFGASGRPQQGAQWPTLEQVESLLRSGKRVEWDPPAGQREAFAALCRRYERTAVDHELVRTLDELEALPDDVTRVECRDLGDTAAALLAKRTNLVALELINDAPADRLTAKGLTAICKLPKLESLVMMNLRELQPADLRAIGGMRSLRTLRVVDVPFDDEALAALPAASKLEELSLLAVPTFGAAGVAAIARCTNLKKLELRKATWLDADALAQLGALRQLTELDLGGNPGLRDRALTALQHCTALRRLHLADGAFTSVGLQALTGMRELDLFDVSGNGELVTSALLHVPAGVRTLRLARCPGLDANAATLLRDRFPQLAELDVAQNGWVTDDVVRTLLAGGRLQRLDLLRCSKLTTAVIESIVATRSLRHVVLTGTAVGAKEHVATLRERRPDLEVVGFVW